MQGLLGTISRTSFKGERTSQRIQDQILECCADAFLFIQCDLDMIKLMETQYPLNSWPGAYTPELTQMV